MRVGTLTVIEVYRQGEPIGRGYIINDPEFYNPRPTIYDFDGNELPVGQYQLKLGETFPIVITDWIH